MLNVNLRCPGESFQDQQCNQHVCPEWSDWSNWSHCIDRDSKQPRACGEKERFRMCSEVEGGCPGDAIEYDQVFILSRSLSRF